MPSTSASKESFEFAGLKRSYALFAPASAAASGAPLLVLLHGSLRQRRCDRQLVDPTRASKRASCLSGPDAREREAWQLRADGPQFIRALIDDVAAKHPIDRSRIYLFGSSGGAVYSLTLSMLESELFAATAVHAGAWRAAERVPRRAVRASQDSDCDLHRRRDEYFPLFAVRKTQKALEQAGHRVSVTVIPRHRHAYSEVAAEVNRSAWEFLKGNRL